MSLCSGDPTQEADEGGDAVGVPGSVCPPHLGQTHLLGVSSIKIDFLCAVSQLLFCHLSLSAAVCVCCECETGESWAWN